MKTGHKVATAEEVLVAKGEILVTNAPIQLQCQALLLSWELHILKS